MTFTTVSEGLFLANGCGFTVCKKALVGFLELLLEYKVQCLTVLPSTIFQQSRMVPTHRPHSRWHTIPVPYISGKTGEWLTSSGGHSHYLMACPLQLLPNPDRHSSLTLQVVITLHKSVDHLIAMDNETMREGDVVYGLCYIGTVYLLFCVCILRSILLIILLSVHAQYVLGLLSVIARLTKNLLHAKTGHIPICFELRVSYEWRVMA